MLAAILSTRPQRIETTMATGTQNKIYSNQNFRPLKIRDVFQFVRGNVSGFAHEGSETGAASVIGPNSTPGGSPDVPFVIGVFSAMSEAAQPGNIRAIDSELLFNYPGSVAVEVNPTGIDGQPTAGNQNTAATSIASVRGAITVGGTYTGATAGTGTAGVDPSRTTATTITAGFLYGVQGKLIVCGTINAGSNVSAGLQGQLDLSAAVAITSPVAALWLDMGATASAALISAPTYVNAIAVYNTTAAVINSAFQVIANATYLFDVTDLSQGGSHFYNHSGSGLGSIGTDYLVVLVNGVPKHIPLYA